MRSAILWALLLTGLTSGTYALAAQISPSHTLNVQLDFSPGTPRCRWVGSYFPQYTRALDGSRPKVWMINRDGKTVIPETEIWFPDAIHVEISAVTADPSGALYASAQVWSHNKSATGIICKVVAGQTDVRVTRTDDFLGRALGATKEGEVWAFGLPLMLQTVRHSNEEYMTIWRLDASGRIVQRLLPRSTFGDNVMPTHRYGDVGGPHVCATSTRVGFYSATAHRWVEIDPRSGEKITDVTVDPPTGADGTKAHPAEVVMTNSLEVYAFFTYGGAIITHPPGLYRLDKSASHWILIDEPSRGTGFGGLFGVDGDELILRSGPYTFGWIPAKAFTHESGSSNPTTKQ